WQVIDAPQGTKFLFPEGPLSVNTGFAESRAWWRIDVEKLERDFASGRSRNLSREVPPGLGAAREHLLAFFAEACERYGVVLEKTILGGFSQGAMLACDVVLRSDMPLGGLAVLSGSLLGVLDEVLGIAPLQLPEHQHGEHNDHREGEQS
ncbi:hypothetical protein IH799_08895, partial [candidate division KSB1 bacterium]|nr:hypothetical protein [candidate division KSB1 bacterium]